MIALVVGVSLTLPYLGTERFGVWMTIISLAALLTFLDFGIGNGLLNLVAHAAAGDERRKLTQIITNGLIVLFIAGGLAGSILWTASHFVPWDTVIKIQDPSVLAEVRSSVSVFVFIFGLSLPLLGVQRVFLGLQEGFLVHLVSFFASAISLLSIFVVTMQKGGVPQLIIATLGIQALAPIVLCPLLFKRGLLKVNSIRHFRNDAATLLRTGSLFFVLQLGAMIAWGSDSIIVSAMLGASQVATLAITQRLFQFISQPLAMLMNPLWSTYADAASRKDSKYIRQTLKSSVAVAFFVSFAGSIFLLLFHQLIISKWTSKTIELPMLLVVACALWCILDCIGNSFAMFLNGLGVLRPQLKVVAMFCLVAIPLKIYLTTKIGVSGVIFAAVIAYTLTVALPYLTFLKSSWTIRL